jgi:hypothetical protein
MLKHFNPDIHRLWNNARACERRRKTTQAGCLPGLRKLPHFTVSYLHQMLVFLAWQSQLSFIRLPATQMERAKIKR